MNQNPFSPQSNMSFFGGVSDMSTMLPGGRSTFNMSGPATAAAPAATTTTSTTDPNAAAIAAAAAALGTTPSTAATSSVASPFAPASNLNFAGSAATTPVTSAASPAVSGGLLPGGNPATVYAGQTLPQQGPQYAAANSGMPGSWGAGDRPLQGTPEWDQLQRARQLVAGIGRTRQYGIIDPNNQAQIDARIVAAYPGLSGPLPTPDPTLGGPPATPAILTPSESQALAALNGPGSPQALAQIASYETELRALPPEYYSDFTGW